MTTIACDGREIAADGLVTSDNFRMERNARKILVEDGAIYAIAGTQCLMRPLVDWVKAGADPDKLPKFGEMAWGLLVISRTRAVHYQSRCHFPEEVSYPFTTGSGREIALGAMRAGRSAREAVEIACEEDVWSGGKILSYNISEALGQPIREAAE